MNAAQLAAVADRVREELRQAFPAEIRAGRMSREEAEFEIEGWDEIAALFRKEAALPDPGRACVPVAPRWMSWPELELAASRDLLRREHAVEQAKLAAAEPERLRRLILQRDSVAAIYQQIADYRALLDGLAQQLRSSVGAPRSAPTAGQGRAA